MRKHLFLSLLPAVLVSLAGRGQPLLILETAPRGRLQILGASPARLVRLAMGLVNRRLPFVAVAVAAARSPRSPDVSDVC